MHRRMKNPFNPKSQNYRILERLRECPATNAELVKYALNYTARISEIRAKISEQGLGVLEKPLGGGRSEYRIDHPIRHRNYNWMLAHLDRSKSRRAAGRSPRRARP